MTKPKHTPEPWNIPTVGSGKMIWDSKGTCIALVRSLDNAEANAKRIVACVNACEGINPEAVSDMYAALVHITDAFEINIDGAHAEAIFNKAKKAIAKAEGRT